MFRGQNLSLSSGKNITATPNPLVPTGKATLNFWKTHVFSTGMTNAPDIW